MYTLVLAGADYSTCRSDHLSTNVRKTDKDKESKSIGKSAGQLAVCAVLILTIAVAAPFNVTKFYNDQKKEVQGVSTSLAFRIFVISDVMAFTFSAVAVSCCTLAGFSSMDRGTRLVHLITGVAFLWLAALSLVIVFATGVYVAVAPVVYVWTSLIFYLFGAIVIVPQLNPVFMMLVHAWALRMRLGCPAWCRSVFLPLSLQRQGRVRRMYRGLCFESLAVIFFIFIVFYLILEFAPRSRPNPKPL